MILLAVVAPRYYDFEPLVFYIKWEIQGKGEMTCLDLPEKMWRRIPMCFEGESENETEPGVGQFIDEGVG